MLKYLFLLVTSIVVWGCSSSKKLPAYETVSPYEPPEYYEQIIDSTTVVASIQSIDYPWNTEGHLVNLQRYYKASPPFISPFSINLSFEDIKPDTLRIYFCLINDSKCMKIAEQYFNGGLYSVGFQKLNVEAGWYNIKITSSDDEYLQTYLIAP